MENKTLHLLILEDNPDDAELAVMELKREGFTLEWSRVDTEQGFKEALAGMPDLILVDYALPSFDGISALHVHRQLAPDIPLIIFSGTIGEEVAIECMKSGAMDYVFKNRISRLGPVVKRALKEAKADRREKQAKEAFEENEKHLNTILNSIQTGIVAIDSETHEIIYANPAAVKIIGAPKEQIIGHVCNKYICPAAKGACPITDLGQKMDNSEQILLKANGEEIPVLKTAIQIMLNHKECLLESFIDISEKKKLETQLRQAQKMEAIGTLAGGIAHDFNNILFPIIGYAEITMDEVPEDSLVRKNLDEILSGALRAGDLVKQILTFSRQHDQELKPLKVQLVVREALKLIRSSLPSTIKISQNVEKKCGLVMAYPIQIHQVVMNLCTNAFQAMEKTGGALAVSLRNVDPIDSVSGNVDFGLEGAESTIKYLESKIEYPDMAPGPHLCLTVGDTGQGMGQTVMDRIFDPYFTTKETGKGTGLGLSVVHGIIKSHGGEIRVYSEPGKGTVFHVYLPVIKADFVSSETVSDKALPTGHEHILLVDDEPRIIKMFQRILERLGYKVTARTGSIDALETFRAQPDKFDLVITDMTMPNMTGDKLAGKLIKIQPDIAIILCTGFSEGMTKKKAASLGIKGFLMKPIKSKDLSMMIRKTLDSAHP
ncbi:MAG: response regulator [Thermodesulfobacteriota bacterium]|nr:response regulator [Thermodesulfobacteriota bacterium]